MFDIVREEEAIDERGDHHQSDKDNRIMMEGIPDIGFRTQKDNEWIVWECC